MSHPAAADFAEGLLPIRCTEDVKTRQATGRPALLSFRNAYIDLFQGDRLLLHPFILE